MVMGRTPTATQLGTSKEPPINELWPVQGAHARQHHDNEADEHGPCHDCGWDMLVHNAAGTRSFALLQATEDVVELCFRHERAFGSSGGGGGGNFLLGRVQGQHLGLQGRGPGQGQLGSCWLPRGGGGIQGGAPEGDGAATGSAPAGSVGNGLCAVNGGPRSRMARATNGVPERPECERTVGPVLGVQDPITRPWGRRNSGYERARNRSRAVRRKTRGQSSGGSRWWLAGLDEGGGPAPLRSSYMGRGRSIHSMMLYVYMATNTQAARCIGAQYRWHSSAQL